ncbi:MAG: hypothetical protein NVS3B28_03130 [Candidatus Velthaea sp.]
MKTILITGASSGIGRALAIRAARAGYNVFAVGRNTDALASLTAKIASENGSIATDATDIAKPGSARGIVARALARFGSLDVLVNNAGFVSAGAIGQQSDAELERQFAVHVVAPLALVREAHDALRATGGHVFMLGSGVARVPVGSLGAYPPAKAAIRSATAILRRELKAGGIAVTYVDPGAVATPFMTRAGMASAPENILVSPEEVARKILLAVASRPRTLNAAPWQTTVVALAELFPRITDFVLERNPALVGGDAVPALSTVQPAPSLVRAADATPEVAMPSADLDPFESALEPHRRRMEKLKLSESFVRDLLAPHATLDAGEVAMRWAGMPNKNERALTSDVLDALADAGYLKKSSEHAYDVVRAP